MILRLHVAALLFATTAVHAQTTFTDAGTYSTTTDKIAIGSTTAPTRELEVFGKALVTGDLQVGGGSTNVYGRVLQVAPNWVGMTVNTSFNGTAWQLDADGLPAWMFKLDSRPGYEALAVARMPAGTSPRPDTAWLPYFAISPTGNVGINMGWTGPATARFEVRGTAAVEGTGRRIVYLWDDTTSAVGVGAGIGLAGKYNAAGDYSEFANVKGVKLTATEGDRSGNLVLSVRANNGANNEVVRISKPTAGTPGTAPGTVWIDADLVVTGNLAAKYQDVAEWVPAVGRLDAGTVVVISPEHRNAVMASSGAYDSAVAGVVSAQPGLTLGEAGADKVMVATTGRVKIKVDATDAPIRAGDLLVTSGRSGMAMKSEAVDVAGVKFHRPGTVVGKALEPLAGGTGEILVLLSLQ
jgi:hypothetical protein